MPTTLLLARHRSSILADIISGSSLGQHLAVALLTIIAGGASYGAVIGSWHGSRLAIYAAIKVPLLLLLTAVVTSLFNWIVGSLLGLPLGFRQTFVLTLVPLSIAAIVMASLAPVGGFFTIALPPPGAAQRTLHNVLYLIHTAVIAAAGFAGTQILRGSLLTVCDGDRAKAHRVQLAWIAAYALVAGEIAWALRPFVGSVYLPVVFLRDDALNGNVYEFILNDIIPHLLRRIL